MDVVMSAMFINCSLRHAGYRCEECIDESDDDVNIQM
jgi:hypothetical protein